MVEKRRLSVPLPGRRPALAAGLLLCAYSQPGVPAEPLESRVLACAGIATSAERLTCYDAVAAGIRPAAAADAPPSARESSPGNRAAETEFGLPRAPSSAEQKRGSLDSITAHVVRLGATAEGRVLLTLDNGQLWQQLDGRDLQLGSGDAVKISRAALGSFWLSTSSSTGARVKRVR